MTSSSNVSTQDAIVESSDNREGEKSRKLISTYSVWFKYPGTISSVNNSSSKYLSCVTIVGNELCCNIRHFFVRQWVLHNFNDRQTRERNTRAHESNQQAKFTSTQNTGARETRKARDDTTRKFSKIPKIFHAPVASVLACLIIHSFTYHFFNSLVKKNGWQSTQRKSL